MRRKDRKLSSKLDPILSEQADIAKDILDSLSEIEQEAERIAKIMYSAPQILEDLDRQFKEATKLTSTDINFLFITVGLQCLRQYVFASDKYRLTHRDGDKLIGKVIPKKWQDILLASVPYDAIQKGESFSNEDTGLAGSTHRFRTLGHDPIFGWFFGPVNIISDSLTKTNLITTYQVSNSIIEGDYPGGTIGAILDSYHLSCQDKYLLPVAVMRQAIHFGSDYFTKQGLPLPLIGTFNNDFAKMLVTKFNVDMYSVTRSATLSILINTIISYVHAMFYDESSGLSPEMYAVRTRKIISYSNTIASTSNIIYVAVNGFLGNSAALKKLDVGGLLVTLYRLFSDYRYIAQMKNEFLEKEFYNLVNNKYIEEQV